MAGKLELEQAWSKIGEGSYMFYDPSTSDFSRISSNEIFTGRKN